MSSQSLFDQFVAVCSRDRINAYRVGEERDLDVLTRYMWNAALCESLYPVLNFLEVGLRNRLNEAFKESFGNTDWYADPAIVLDDLARQKVAEAERSLRKNGKRVTSMRVISELSFGFWTRLVAARQQEAIWRRPGLLKLAFPYVPKLIRKRSTLARRFGEARQLRNRVFHYEPIWFRDLPREYSSVVEALGWLDPCLQQISRVNDRFSNVCTESFQQEIRSKLIRACRVESRNFVLASKEAVRD